MFNIPTCLWCGAYGRCATARIGCPSGRCDASKGEYENAFALERPLGPGVYDLARGVPDPVPEEAVNALYKARVRPVLHGFSSRLLGFPFW
jgi:hypothetical protein